MKPLIVALAAVTLLPACGKSEEDPERARPTPTASTETEAAAAQSDALPVEADYEAQAEETVTTDNLEAQVSELEKELAADTQ